MAADVYAGRPRDVTPRPPWPLTRFLRLLLPAPCLGCGSPLPAPAGEAGGGYGGRPLGLCTGCRGRLRPLDPATACAVCARPLVGRLPKGFRCDRCRAWPPAYDRLYARWRYEAPLDAVVSGLKFRRLDFLGAHLGRDLATAFAPIFAADLSGLDLVVAVPLHWGRRLARGYNQAERIARPLAAHLGLPLAAALRRRRATAAQSALPRGARLDNLAGAVDPHPRVALAGRRILLVDDVATTGATLDAAAHALKRAGAATVVAVVVGRTPDPSA
jgi:ComF family protein